MHEFRVLFSIVKTLEAIGEKGGDKYVNKAKALDSKISEVYNVFASKCEATGAMPQ